MEKHGPADEVEPGEHEGGEQQVNGHVLLVEVVHWGRVDRADDDLGRYLHYPVSRQGYLPVVHTVVHHEQLPKQQKKFTKNMKKMNKNRYS